MKFSFKYKLLVAFLLYGFGLVFLTQFVVFKINEANIKSLSLEKASETFLERDKLFKSYIQGTELKILAIKDSAIFQDYLSNLEETALLDTLFVDIARTSDNIMQLRYIDSRGSEVVRVDREEFASKPYLVKKENLQDKSSRYYFKDILNLERNKFLYSDFDLNIEHSKVQRPVKPVIRIGTPVFKDGVKTGILIVNIFMKNFLQELTDVALFDIYLFDKDGNVLVDSIHKYCWSKYLENNESIYNHFEDEADLIISNNRYIGKDFYAGKIFLQNSENITMIVKPKKTFIQSEINENISELAGVMLGIILFSFPFAYFFSKTPVRLKEEADKHRAEQDVLLSLFDLSDAVLFKWNNDANWSVNYVSKSVQKLLGYTQKDFNTDKVAYSNCIHSDDIQQVMKEVSDAVENRVYFFEHKPYRVVAKDGGIKWILDSTVVVRNEHDEIISFVGYLTDVTEIKDKEIALKNLSRTDQLTKISNRMHLDEVLQSQYYRFCRDKELTSIILIDIDFFKAVNDEYGHLVGDATLIEFVDLLKLSIREGDTLGRWGGEEFLVILPYTDISQAKQLAEKLREKVCNYVFKTIKHKTASFGVSTFEDGMSIEAVIDSADTALYKAKDSGRNCVVSIQNGVN